VNTEQGSIVKAKSDSEGIATGRPCLLLILRSQLTLAKDLKRPLKSFVVGKKQYHDAGFGEWTVFYDWLRDSDGKLLGVRYWLEQDTEFLVDYTKRLGYVQAVSTRHIEIYFSERRAVDPKLSCDHAFLYDAIFRSDDGEHAIGFGVEELSDDNLRTLQDAKGEWVDVSDPRNIPHC
jgi:hypothetical protein